MSDFITILVLFSAIDCFGQFFQRGIVFPDYRDRRKGVCRRDQAEGLESKRTDKALV